ncbi:MAG: hypothetical protein IH802_13715 [Nitrospinae bacterium]|nr:hypothetical protein [Nitrospinota bacterium]
MIKIFKTVISLGLVLSLTTSASAEGFWDGQSYFGLSGMLAVARNSDVDSASGNPNPAFVNDAEVTTLVGYGVSAYYGWLFDSNWRAEFELSRRGVNLNRIAGPAGTVSLNGDLALNSFFVNGARDFRGSSFVTPYLGVGVGVAVGVAVGVLHGDLSLAHPAKPGDGCSLPRPQRLPQRFQMVLAPGKVRVAKMRHVPNKRQGTLGLRAL